MNGTLYGIGVGPGEPELLTLKAARLIRDCDLIAVPHRDPKQCAALSVALGAVPEAKDKPVLAIDMPMTRDASARERAYEAGAKALEAALDEGKTVAFLTLGDPSVYSTYGYLQTRLLRAGYDVRTVPGVPSFCAAAAELNAPLCLDREPLHLIPGGEPIEDALALEGVKVFMKGGTESVLRAIKRRGCAAQAVENCGTPEQRVYRGIDEIPNDTGYFTVIIVKENEP